MRVAWIALIAGCGFHGLAPVVEGASVADAGFDAATCPTSYDVALPGPARYRLIPDGHPAWIQSDACALDLPGATHLAVLTTSDEIAAVGALVTTPPRPIAGNAVFVGAVQQRTATQPGDGWLWFDGEPVTSGWGGAEPNDRGDGEADHDEQFVKIEKAKPYLTDTAGSDSNAALCQCDGKPIAASAASAITANRPPS
jgi:hypothetical protein